MPSCMLCCSFGITKATEGSVVGSAGNAVKGWATLPGSWLPVGVAATQFIHGLCLRMYSLSGGFAVNDSPW